jgi:hypothetical protein
VFDRLKIALIRKMARKRLGKDIAPLKNLEAHPGVMIPYARFNLAPAKTSLVPNKLKVLGQVRAAKLVECPF